MLILHQRSFKIGNNRYTTNMSAMLCNQIYQCSLVRGNTIIVKPETQAPVTNAKCRARICFPGGRTPVGGFPGLFSRFLVQNEKNNLWDPLEEWFSPVNTEIIASLAVFYHFSRLLNFSPISSVEAGNIDKCNVF